WKLHRRIPPHRARCAAGPGFDPDFSVVSGKLRLKPHLHLRRPAWAAPLCSKRILSAVLLPDDRVDVTEKRPRLLTLVRRDQREKENERLGVQSMLARVHELDFQVVLSLGKFHGDAAASMVRRSGGGIRWIGVVKVLLAIQ